MLLVIIVYFSLFCFFLSSTLLCDKTYACEKYYIHIYPSRIIVLASVGPVGLTMFHILVHFGI